MPAPSKKRRLSPSASSRASSATPAPSLTSGQQTLPPLTDSSSALPTEFASTGEGLAGPGPSTLDQAKQSAVDLERRAFARSGSIVQGSGDGQDFGEECFLWTDLPIAKNFRYTPCTLSPTTSPHPKVPFYRSIPYPPPTPPVHISWVDRSAFIRVSSNALTVTNDRGFRSARANVSVREGSWYYEVYIERGDGKVGSGGGTGGDAGNAHVRLGWGRREAIIDAPVGSDAYSYAIRDVGGEKVHVSRSVPYGRSFQTGDVIGCLISLPSRSSSSREKGQSPDDPAVIKRQRRPFNYKGQQYFEMAEYPTSKEMDSLVDRVGKGVAAVKVDTEGDTTGQENGNVPNGSDQANGHASGPGGKGKKGATTKNAKKGKKAEPQPVEHGLRELATLKGSSVSFFLNGEPLGNAFTNLYDFTPLPPLHVLASHSGKRHPADRDRDGAEISHDDGTLGYYPMVSCFGKGKARCNFGPDFTFPPPVDTGARAMSERWEEFREEERILDEKDEAEDTKKLLILMEEEKKLNALAARGGGLSKKKKAAVSKRKKGMMDVTPAPDGTETPSARATPAPSEVDVKVEHIDGDSRPRSLSNATSVSAFNKASTPAHELKDNDIHLSVDEAKSKDRHRSTSVGSRSGLVVDGSPGRTVVDTSEGAEVTRAEVKTETEPVDVPADVKSDAERQTQGHSAGNEGDDTSEDGEEGVAW